jgi:hypothetical protein
MTQAHLAAEFCILKHCFVNNSTPTPSTEAMEYRFVAWLSNKATLLPATPTPLCIINLVFHANASILT